MPALRLVAANLSEYEGYRIRQEGPNPIYLVLDGKRHHIPNPKTHDGLFAGGDRDVHNVLDINIVPEGDPLSDGAILARAKERQPIYLVTNGQKRHIGNPAVFKKFGFDDGKLKEVEHVLLDFIPTGKEIN